MRERHHKLMTTRWACLSVTAALFLLAGTSEAVGQTAGAPKKSSASKTSTAGAPAQSAAPASPASAPKTAGGPGKIIHEAGNSASGASGATGASGDTGDAKVKVDDNLIVDLHVNDEDLANVLQMLSIQAQKNIVTSKNVSAVVTANLYGVTFYEALDAILHVNGYGYIDRGNFIYVYTLDELQKIEDAAKAPVWKVLKMNYLNSVDAAEFVKPLLSDKGQIKTNSKVAASTGTGDAPGGGEDFAHDSTLVVFDYPENLGEIEKILKEMDTRPAQVLVEATILQTTLNEANAFGVDFSIIGDLNFTDFVNVGGPLNAANALISGGSSSSSSSSSSGSGSGTGTGTGTGSGSGSSGATAIPSDNKGSAITSTAGNTAGPGTLKLGIVANDVAAFVKILDEVSDTTIISRPNVLCLNRQAARVLVGRKVGYLSSTSTDTSTTQTVEFLDTGTQLVVRPFVSSDGMIRMELKPKVSEAVIRNVTNTGGAAVTIPDEISNELTTNVMVRDGQTIVLGGLFREEIDATRREVPGIGDVPIIGAAFRGNEDNTQRSEIIFMITPSIVNDTVLLEQGKRAEASVDRVRSGAREGLLPFSREKRTQQLVVQATELFRQGKNEEALYKANRALALNQNQQDAIAIREAIMNKKSRWPSRSVQNEIITGELQKTLGGKAASPAMMMPSAPASSTSASASSSSNSSNASGSNNSASSSANSSQSSKMVSSMKVSVETLEPMEGPKVQSAADQSGKVWLPATSPEDEQMPAESDASASENAPHSTAAASKPTLTPAPFPGTGLDTLISSVMEESPSNGSSASSATSGAPSSNASAPSTDEQSASAPTPSTGSPAAQSSDDASSGPAPSSFAFWSFWRLYMSYAQHQFSPQTTPDSTVTSAPEGDSSR